MGIKVILITIVFLLQAFSITTASRKIDCSDCQNLSLSKHWRCDCNHNITMSFFTIDDKKLSYNIEIENSSGLETFFFYILESSDECSSEWFDKCADEFSGEQDDKCFKCVSYGPEYFSSFRYHSLYDISSNQQVQFIVKNKSSLPQVCCVHFRNQEEETFASPANNSSSVNIAIIPDPGHLDLKIICLIIFVVVCCFGILAGLIYLYQRKGTRNIPEVPLPEVEKPIGDIRFLFIYDSNDNQSFKEIVRILQNIIKNTEKCEVVDLWEELNDIATLAPHNWFQNHIKVKNFKVVLLLNRQIMNYMVNTNTSTEPPQDTLGRSMICFFSQFFYHLSSDQLITISILNPPSPDSLNGSKLYILPDHFKELVYDFGCGKYLDDEAMRKHGMKLAVMCKQYIEG